MAGASEIVVTLPGGRRVEAELGGHRVRTDQPRDLGGEDGAPSPFQLFLASIATCAGVFVQGFCARRDLDPSGIRIRMRPAYDPAGVLASAELDIELPPGFPEKYRDALVRVADQCSVKKAIQAQPRFAVRAVAGPAGG
jgi:ribosomal protein S12 methylthiotransferase accessory factor